MEETRKVLFFDKDFRTAVNVKNVLGTTLEEMGCYVDLGFAQLTTEEAEELGSPDRDYIVFVDEMDMTEDDMANVFAAVNLVAQGTEFPKEQWYNNGEFPPEYINDVDDTDTMLEETEFTYDDLMDVFEEFRRENGIESPNTSKPKEEAKPEPKKSNKSNKSNRGNEKMSKKSTKSVTNNETTKNTPKMAEKATAGKESKPSTKAAKSGKRTTKMPKPTVKDLIPVGTKVQMYAFTGMYIGEFDVTIYDDNTISVWVENKKRYLEFDRKTGLQTNCDKGKERWANRIAM